MKQKENLTLHQVSLRALFRAPLQGSPTKKSQEIQEFIFFLELQQNYWLIAILHHMCFGVALISTVVQFYPWFNFYFPLFLCKVMYDNEYKTK